jgi:hypothetical protein
MVLGLGFPTDAHIRPYPSHIFASIQVQVQITTSEYVGDSRSVGLTHTRLVSRGSDTKVGQKQQSGKQDVPAC